MCCLPPHTHTGYRDSPLSFHLTVSDRLRPNDTRLSIPRTLLSTLTLSLLLLLLLLVACSSLLPALLSLQGRLPAYTCLEALLSVESVCDGRCARFCTGVLCFVCVVCVVRGR